MTAPAPAEAGHHALLLTALNEHAACDFRFKGRQVIYECGVEFSTKEMSGLGEIARRHLADVLAPLVAEWLDDTRV